MHLFGTVIPLTCGCFYGRNAARAELTCQSLDRFSISTTEVLQTASVPVAGSASNMGRGLQSYRACIKALPKAETAQMCGPAVLLCSPLQF